MKKLRIATRRSPLALWQAHYVGQLLKTQNPNMSIEYIELTTTGDKLLKGPLASKGGKGLFTKELELALLENRADIAVHSMKDMPIKIPDPFVLAAICMREDARDVFISYTYPNLTTLPIGAIIGTSSLRRQSQIRALRPDLEIVNIRGNVHTRLSKLAPQGSVDAIILAAAGLIRLNQKESITEYLPKENFLPAVGQGAIGIECRADNLILQEYLTLLNHMPTRLCIEAERSMNAHLQGGCQVPIAGHASFIHDHTIHLRGMVAKVDGSLLLHGEDTGRDPQKVGASVASKLLKQGAGDILKEIYSHSSTRY